MEPWFEWSWLCGLKPIHPKGWLLALLFWLLEAPLMFAAVGAFHLAPLEQAMAAFLFVFLGFGILALSFSKFKHHD